MSKLPVLKRVEDLVAIQPCFPNGLALLLVAIHVTCERIIMLPEHFSLWQRHAQACGQAKTIQKDKDLKVLFLLGLVIAGCAALKHSSIQVLMRVALRDRHSAKGLNDQLAKLQGRHCGIVFDILFFEPINVAL